MFAVFVMVNGAPKAAMCTVAAAERSGDTGAEAGALPCDGGVLAGALHPYAASPAAAAADVLIKRRRDSRPPVNLVILTSYAESREGR
jgi:hypothetical protein